MRIAFLTHLRLPETGGAEIFLERLLGSLKKRGHEVVAVAPKARNSGRELPCPHVRTLRAFSKRFGLHHQLPSLLYAYLRRPFDVLHAHGEYQPAVVARTFKRLTRRPYVVRALGGGFRRADEYPFLRRRIRKALRAADASIAQGEHLRRRIEEHGGDPQRIVTIHNGIDFSEIEVEGPRPYSEPYVFYAGGLRKVKGYDVLLKAFARIAGDVAPAILVLAGKDQELEKFAALRNALGLDANRVRWAGLLPRRDLVLHLRHAEVYVCPFRRAPFSNANLEALAAGCPVVATSVDGNLEQIRDGVEGFLVPPEDDVALGDALRRILRDADLRARLSRAARERARAFDWEVMVGRYEALYRAVVEGSPLPA